MIGEDIISVIRGLGLIGFRIAMLLTIFKRYDRKKDIPLFYCEDVDFKSAMLLVKTYLTHALLMYNRLPKGDSSFDKVGPFRRKFYESLPDEFQRKQAVEIGKEQFIADRTVTDYLKLFLEQKLLEQPKYGIYKKIKNK